jgi:hypothetical protein
LSEGRGAGLIQARTQQATPAAFTRIIPDKRPCRHLEFLTPDELKAIMERAGLRNVTYRRLMMSTVAIHVGSK